jgi:phage/plasmid-associated DNA primase
MWLKEDVLDIVRYKVLISIVSCYDDEQNLLNGEEGLANIFCKYAGHYIKVIDTKIAYIWDDNTKLWKETNIIKITNEIYGIIKNVGESYKMKLNDEIEKFTRIIIARDNKDNFIADVNIDDINRKLSICKFNLKSLNKTLKQITSASKRKSVMFIAHSQLEDYDFESKLNNKRHLIPLNDGNVLDFSNNTVKLRKRTKQDMFSKSFNVSLPYEIIDDEMIIKNTGYYSKINEFMMQIMNNDQETLLYFQKLIGYSLTSEKQERFFSIWHGCGSNGKSTIIDIISRIMGDYYSTLSKQVLIKSGIKACGGQATPEL